MKKTFKWITLTLLLCMIVLGGYFLNKALPIGTGYSAKYVCSQVFLAGRNPDQVFQKEVLPTHPMFRLVRLTVDNENKMVTAKGFGFWKPMTAVYRPGCGCTLLVDTDRQTLVDQARNLLPTHPQRTRDPWPEGDRVDLSQLPAQVDVQKLHTAVEKAFIEPGPQTRRNTQAVVVVLGNQVIAEKYAPGFHPDTPFLGWSMAKSVTCALVGILVKDQVLDIHQPAAVSAWQSPSDPRSGITLDMLLRMSSGLEFEEVYGPFKDATDMLYTSRSMADFAADKPLRFAPDTHWSYSSGTANIIAAIVTRHAGDTLAAVHRFSQERLFHKIRAYSAIIEPDASGTIVGSSYMFATARDWARFGLLLKNDGVWNGERILPHGWVSYATTPTKDAPMGQYGAQFWLNAGDPDRPENRKFPSLPNDLYYCGGFNGQIVAVIPSRNLVVVRLGVTHDDSWDHESFIGQVLDAVEKT